MLRREEQRACRRKPWFLRRRSALHFAGLQVVTYQLTADSSFGSMQLRSMRVAPEALEGLSFPFKLQAINQSSGFNPKGLAQWTALFTREGDDYPVIRRRPSYRANPASSQLVLAWRGGVRKINDAPITSRS